MSLNLANVQEEIRTGSRLIENQWNLANLMPQAWHQTLTWSNPFRETAISAGENTAFPLSRKASPTAASVCQTPLAIGERLDPRASMMILESSRVEPASPRQGRGPTAE